MFNWIDLVIILFLVYFVFESFRKPLLVELIDFASFLISFFSSFRYYSLAAPFFEKNFQIPHSLSLVLGFVSIWFLTELLIYFLARFSLRFLPKISFKGLDYLSFIPSLFKGLILIALFLVLIATFPIQPQIKKAVNESKIGSLILEYSYRLEGPVKQVFGGVSKERLTFLTIEPKTGESVDLGFKTKDLRVDETTEASMIELVNKERVSRGLNSLSFDGNLREVARFHSRDMFQRGYFSHYSPEGQSVVDRAEKFGIDYQVIGENLAFAPSLDLAHGGLMNSPGHRANILSPDFHKIGVGVMDGGVYGRMFTQVFSN